jgi:hypothetical protein
VVGKRDRYHAKAFYRDEPRLRTGKAGARDTGVIEISDFRSLKGSPNHPPIPKPEPRILNPERATH